MNPRLVRGSRDLRADANDVWLSMERLIRVPAGSKTVAVVVPGYNRSEFTPDEEVSFRHLEKFLGRYDKFLVVPRSLSIRRPGFQLKRFDDKFFGSAIANTRLMLSRLFYESFVAYDIS